ncbi:hypothetical protein H8A99_30405 [Bradyrhizobium sp. Arg68]|uniref:hypothetical protein n=1 Tax=Bradyrhizobium ivorense TaxID=2511166 RepID=UPI001E60F3BC|nr:hypothetical protein [Bradyrhizobium ivorense]MCC8940640.1 hypothetical protein [Bradyrhizobium ivorense]
MLSFVSAGDVLLNTGGGLTELRLVLARQREIAERVFVVNSKPDVAELEGTLRRNPLSSHMVGEIMAAERSKLALMVHDRLMEWPRMSLRSSGLRLLADLSSVR